MVERLIGTEGRRCCGGGTGNKGTRAGDGEMWRKVAMIEAIAGTA